MQKSFILFFHFLCISCSVLGQNFEFIDSINAYSFKIRSHNRDSSRLLGYKALELSNEIGYSTGASLAQLNLGIHYCNGDQLDSASNYLLAVYDKLLDANRNSDLAICNWYMGKLYQKLGNFKTAYQYLNKAENLFREQKNELYLIYVLTEEGYYHEIQGDYQKALEFYTAAYELRVTRGETDFSPNETSNISSIYSHMGMFGKALEFAKKSLQSAQKSGNIASISRQQMKMGKVFNSMNQNDSALHFLGKGYELAVQSGRKALQSDVLLNIANIHNKTGRYDSANFYLIKAKQLGNGLTLLDIYPQLAENYNRNRMPDSSIYYIHKTKKLATKRGSKRHQLLISKTLMDFHDRNGSFDSAFYYSKCVKSFSDSLYNEAKDKKFGELRIQLETLVKEKEIQTLKFEQYENKVRNIIITTSMLFILIMGVIVFLVYRTRQKKRHKELENGQNSLAIQLENSRKKLSNHTLSMIHKNNVFDEIETRIKKITGKYDKEVNADLQKVINAITLNKGLQNDWNNFTNFFSDIHGSFFEYLQSQYPSLSNYDLRMCALIKLKLSNKEIATILSIEHKSVTMAKYRLKKKLNISEEHSLSDFVTHIK